MSETAKSGTAGMSSAASAPVCTSEIGAAPGTAPASGTAPGATPGTAPARARKTARTSYVAQAGMIAAVYAAATLVAMFMLQGLAWGPVQFRISEALTVLALFTPAAVPGLTIGCVIANLVSMAINGTGALGLLDVVFGSFATFLGALWCSKLAAKPKLALLGPVVANALIVPAYLPLILQGLGFYTIPFTSRYLFGLVATGIGQAVVIYVLGYPLSKALARVLPKSWQK